MINPRAEIRVAAGREGHLRSLEALSLYPANSLFVDGYLTTRGDSIDNTYRMIEDAGFEVAGNPAWEQDANETATAYRVPGGGALLKPEVVAE